MSLLGRACLLSSLIVALSPSSATAQSIGYSSVSYFDGTTCGTVGWLAPGPISPSVGYTQGTSGFVLINGQWYSTAPSTYGYPTCTTGGTGSGTTGGTGTTNLLVESVSGSGGAAGGDTNLGPDGWTGDQPVYPTESINTLTVTPEPSTLALLGSGLVGLGVAVRRRRARNQRPQDG